MAETIAPAAGPAEIRPLTQSEFEKIRALAREQFGLDLRQGKEQLVSARLGKKMRAGGFRTFNEYYDAVVRDGTGEALIELINSLTTNFTSFLREPAHFEFLREQVAHFPVSETIEIWSAACASGEEPYSIAICLADQLGIGNRMRFRILATDISTRALEAARKGVYPAERFQDFPKTWLRAYLLKGERHWKDYYRIKPALRERIEFRRLNLTEPFAGLSQYAFIFCRNVMIYFDRETQEGVVGRMAAQLRPGGYLLVGHSESLLGGRHGLEYIQPAIYRRPAGPGRARGSR